jgi:hypothetical protein
VPAELSPFAEGASSKSEGSASASASSVVASFLFGRLRRAFVDCEDGEDLLILDRRVACFMRRLSDLFDGKRLSFSGRGTSFRPARLVRLVVAGDLRIDFVGCEVRCDGRIGAIVARDSWLSEMWAARCVVKSKEVLVDEGVFAIRKVYG